MSNSNTTLINNRTIIEQLLLPHRCVLCSIQQQASLCQACKTSLPKLDPNCCTLCLTPLPTFTHCGACLNTPPLWHYIVAGYRYAFPVDVMIQKLKYGLDLTLTPILASFITSKIDRNPLPDAIIPVPLHPEKMKARGFNQAIEISRYVSKQTGIRVLSDICLRVKNTPSQIELPWKKRQQNVRNAFRCQSDLTNKHIAILDDVMTSGATVNALAKEIIKQGATKVSVWVVARSLLSQKSQNNNQSLSQLSDEFL
ncbi:MAG: ComF family protein [Nitrosomonas sp.]|nr:ComF family protein [Nitrosomonas sp.]